MMKPLATKGISYEYLLLNYDYSLSKLRNCCICIH